MGERIEQTGREQELLLLLLLLLPVIPCCCVVVVFLELTRSMLCLFLLSFLPNASIFFPEGNI